MGICPGGAGAGLRGIWIEHLLLCVRPAVSGRGEDERLLRHCALHRGAAVAGDLPRMAGVDVLRGADGDDRRDGAGHQRSGGNGIMQSGFLREAAFLIDSLSISWDNTGKTCF